MAPAVEHRFTEEPLPQAVVLDADFVVSVLHEGEEFHKDCAQFAARLLEGSASIIYTQLLRLEFMSAWQSAIRRRGIPDAMRPRQGRLFGSIEGDRDDLYKLGDDFLADFLSRFNRYEVRLSATLQNNARRLMASYNLRPMDACLVAGAFQTGVQHVASLDRDFRRVDDIDLWNGHVPARRQAKRRRSS
ncbi:MAG: type II toxin-antitoxin system VapC family toxin [Dehalococcoidia bacterium]